MEFKLSFVRESGAAVKNSFIKTSFPNGRSVRAAMFFHRRLGQNNSLAAD